MAHFRTQQDMHIGMSCSLILKPLSLSLSASISSIIPSIKGILLASIEWKMPIIFHLISDWGVCCLAEDWNYVYFVHWSVSSCGTASTHSVHLLPNLPSATFMLVAWNWLWWEYLHHRHGKHYEPGSFFLPFFFYRAHCEALTRTPLIIGIWPIYVK